MCMLELEATVPLVDLLVVGYLWNIWPGVFASIFVILPFSYLSDFCRYYHNSAFSTLKLLNLTLLKFLKAILLHFETTCNIL